MPCAFVEMFVGCISRCDRGQWNGWCTEPSRSMSRYKLPERSASEIDGCVREEKGGGQEEDETADEKKWHFDKNVEFGRQFFFILFLRCFHLCAELLLFSSWLWLCECVCIARWRSTYPVSRLFSDLIRVFKCFDEIKNDSFCQKISRTIAMFKREMNGCTEWAMFEFVFLYFSIRLVKKNIWINGGNSLLRGLQRQKWT